MIRKFRVYGNSMAPTFKNGDLVLAWRFFLKLKRNDIVVIRHPGLSRISSGEILDCAESDSAYQNDQSKYIIKRIQKIQDKKYFVVGDNEKESTDSREFGWIDKSQIVGKVVYKL